MKTRRQFSLLLQLFEGRFFESEDVSPGGGFQTNLHQVIGFLLTSGFVVSYLTLPAYSVAVNNNRGAGLAWALRGLQLLGPSYSFAVIGFAAFFEWDMLFPNRRDFLILAPFPIRPRDVFAAQFVALAKYLGLLIAAVNLFPTLFTVLGSFFAKNRGTAARELAAQIVATTGVAVFAFLAVAALQGIAINLTSPRWFRRISPYAQMCGMSLMILSLLTYPIYMQLLRHAAETRALWLWLFPPVWFEGFYDLFLPNAQGLFASLGIHALCVSGAVAAVFALTWTAGFRRHYRRTLEAEDTRPRWRGVKTPEWLSRRPEERAIFQFSGKTLARSRKHQLFLVTYLSVGISLALNFATAVRGGKLLISEEGARAFPFLIAFFAISGFRAVFQFPAELASNWLFRITESGWSEIARAVTRKRVLLSGLAPVLLLAALIGIVLGAGWWMPFELAFQLAAGALLIELLFWSFDKVPFTCSYFPGRSNLSILFALYLYGFTSYSFHLADLEAAAERRVLIAVVLLAAGAAILTWCWRRQPVRLAARFDGSEPAIQTLDLT